MNTITTNTLSGCATNGTCFAGNMGIIGFCSGGSGTAAGQGLPAGNNTSWVSAAFNCSNLPGPAGNTSAIPTPAGGVYSMAIQFAPFNNFTNGTLPQAPPPIGSGLSICLNATSTGLFNSTSGVASPGSGSGIPLFPAAVPSARPSRGPSPCSLLVSRTSSCRR